MWPGLAEAIYACANSLFCSLCVRGRARVAQAATLRRMMGAIRTATYGIAEPLVPNADARSVAPDVRSRVAAGSYSTSAVGVRFGELAAQMLARESFAIMCTDMLAWAVPVH